MGKTIYKPKTAGSEKEPAVLLNADGGGRTRTVLPPTDFESVTSANSITSAHLLILYHSKRQIVKQIVKKFRLYLTKPAFLFFLLLLYNNSYKLYSPRYPSIVSNTAILTSPKTNPEASALEVSRAA